MNPCRIFLYCIFGFVWILSLPCASAQVVSEFSIGISVDVGLRGITAGPAEANELNRASQQLPSP
jgi:hypothetical protein